jgi:DNA-binding FadR family transcriptional regulator
VSPAHVLEPTFRKLKRMLMEGAWPQGERLEALRLADDLGVSMTPVRDCLNRLVGERLVDMKHGEGYRVARISEHSLRDMLDVNLALVELALLVEPTVAKPTDIRFEDSGYADRVAILFDNIAARSGNAILCEALRSLSERFHRARMIEPKVIADAGPELEEAEYLFREQLPELKAKMRSFHKRRCDRASDIVRLVD